MFLSPLNELLLILGMAAVTFATRYPVLAWFSTRPLPERFKTALAYVPAAVLTAIIVPAVLAPDGPVQLTLSNAGLFAGFAAALISWRTKNLLAAIVGGMALYWLWGVLF
jgi:branched chain amino acid efflux pump